MKLMIIFLKYLFLIVYLFCGIFTPDLFPVSIRYIVLAISLFIILLDLMKYRKLEITNIYIKFALLFIPFFIYIIIVSIFQSLLVPGKAEIYQSNMTLIITAILTALVNGYAVYLLFKRMNMSYNQMCFIFIIVMVIQLVCVILALLVPDVRYFFNTLIINNSHSERLAYLAMGSNSGRILRAYGFSNNLYDSFGFIVSILITLTFLYAFSQKKMFYAFLGVLMLIAPLVNARTGLIFSLIGVLIALLAYINENKIIKYCFYILLALICCIPLLQFIPEETFSWVSQGMSELFLSFLKGETTGTFSVLLNENIVFPPNLFFGEGMLASQYLGHALDNGYMNCIWQYGLFGTILLLLPYIFVFYSLSKTHSKEQKTLVITISILFFLYLLKVFSLNNFGANFLIFGLFYIISKFGFQTKNGLILRLGEKHR